MKNSNPKDIIGSNKLPLHLWPATATAMGCIAMLNGCLKYGRSNFRATNIRASIYYDAARRHLDAWFEGEECDQEDGVPHLAAALACLAIVIDAGAAGTLDDDRNIRGGYEQLKKEMTQQVVRLKELHKQKNPVHYTKESEEEGLRGVHQAAAQVLAEEVKLLRKNGYAIELLRDLATALDNSIISSRQITSAWQKELDAALEFIRNDS